MPYRRTPRFARRSSLRENPDDIGRCMELVEQLNRIVEENLPVEIDEAADKLSDELTRSSGRVNLRRTLKNLLSELEDVREIHDELKSLS